MIGRTLSIALLSALACFAQERTATLTGTVTSFIGSPISNAKARLVAADSGGVRFSVQSDNSGQFRFSGIPPANYRLEVDSPAFWPWHKTVQLLAGQEKTLSEVILTLDRCGDPSVDSIQRLAPGDESSTLRGSELDSAGLPVSGASVSLNCAQCVTTTNHDGQFIFTNLKPGSYVVTISMIGFYREFSPNYFVYKNLDWTYAPIELEQCPAEGCERTPRQEKILPRCD